VCPPGSEKNTIQRASIIGKNLIAKRHKKRIKSIRTFGLNLCELCASSRQKVLFVLVHASNRDPCKSALIIPAITGACLTSVRGTPN
jgi:hypothetical protein